MIAEVTTPDASTRETAAEAGSVYTAARYSRHGVTITLHAAVVLHDVHAATTQCVYKPVYSFDV
jgi:hypothetical protein